MVGRQSHALTLLRHHTGDGAEQVPLPGRHGPDQRFALSVPRAGLPADVTGPPEVVIRHVRHGGQHVRLTAGGLALVHGLVDGAVTILTPRVDLHVDVVERTHGAGQVGLLRVDKLVIETKLESIGSDVLAFSFCFVDLFVVQSARLALLPPGIVEVQTGDSAGLAEVNIRALLRLTSETC